MVLGDSHQTRSIPTILVFFYNSCFDFVYLFTVFSPDGPSRCPSFCKRSDTHLLFASSTQSHFGLQSRGAESPCAGAPSLKWSVWCSKCVLPLILMVVLRWCVLLSPCSSATISSEWSCFQLIRSTSAKQSREAEQWLRERDGGLVKVNGEWGGL